LHIFIWHTNLRIIVFLFLKELYVDSFKQV